MEAAPFIAVSLLLLIALGLGVGGLAIKYRKSKGRNSPDSPDEPEQ